VSGRKLVVAIVTVIAIAVLAAAWMLFGPDSTFWKAHKS
jgi:hypothetical protein